MLELGNTELLIEKYPWFTTARILRAAEGGGEDAELRLHLQEWPMPRVMMRFDGAAKSLLGDDVERFLAGGEHRVVVCDGTSDEDISAESGVLGDDFASEELAEIYLSQGLTGQARKIYERLGLQNPEKSVYFAELIAKCS